MQSIARGIDVLMALIQGPKTLTEVSRQTGLTKGTAFRILASLSYENVVVKTERNTYLLGPGCLRLLDSVMHGVGAIIGAGREALEALRDKSGETVAVHVRLGTDRICVEELPSPQAIRYTSTVGSSAPLHVGSAGRILVAFAEPEELQRTLDILETSDPSFDMSTLVSALAHIREVGYDFSEGERVHGAAAISVPILGRNGFVAALSVLGPDFRFTRERRIEIIPDPCGAAEVAGAALVDAGELPSRNGDGAG